MPNHIHGIIKISRKVKVCCIRRDAINRVPTNTKNGGIIGKHNPMLHHNSISKIIRWFKGRTTFDLKQSNTIYQSFWQPRFHDRVIRSEYELNVLRQYIKNNPQNWYKDRNNFHNL